MGLIDLKRIHEQKALKEWRDYCKRALARSSEGHLV